jgi:SAM-dependent methyltransferase
MRKRDTNYIYRLKEFLKRYPNFYTILLKVFSPVCPGYGSYKILVRRLPEKARIINIGSGTFRLNKNIINVDWDYYSNVDIMADAQALPFVSSSCDGVISVALMEHLRQPQKHIDEVIRILKPGGLAYAAVPFIQGYHSAPYDFFRWTEEGIEELFSKFKILKIGVLGGPTSGFLWILQEWLAILLSFNIKILYEVLRMLFMLLTFPLKFLDLFLVRYKFARSIASSFYVLAEKPE